MAATVLTIPTLVDVSLGTAETGTVNFNVLRSLFHVIVQQLDLKDVKVVFRGNDSETVQGLIVGLKEKTGWQPDYTVLSPEELVAEADDHGGDEAEAKMVDGAKKRRHPEPAETAYFVESGKVVNRTKGEQRRSQVSASSLARLEGKVKVLQNQIEILGAQAMPSDEALLEATRSSNEGQPIQNLWQNINITKRMSGAEEGIDKLASLLETVAKEYADLKIVIDKMQAEFGQDMTETINQIKMAADYARKLRPREQIYASYLRPKTPEVAERELRTVNAGAEEGESGEGKGAEGAEGAEAEEPSRTARAKQHSRPHHHAKAEVTPRHIPQQVQVEKEVERPWSASSKEGVHSNGPSEGPPGSARGSTFSEQSAESTLVEFREGDITPSNLNRLLGQQAKMKEDIEYVTAQVNTLADFADIILPEILEGLPHMEELKHKIAKLRGETGSQVTLTEEELEEKRRCLTLEQRMEDVETGLAKHWAMLRRQDATICDRTGLLATRIGSIEMDVQIINKKLHIGMDDEDQVANEELANNPVIRGIAAAGEELASNIKDMTEAIAEMFADKEASDRIVNALAEQVELMNTSKANRFEMDDILAEKADCNQLSDKVALRQFDNLCNFFRESLTEVAQKMEAYERMVQGSMLDLQHGLDTKFDKEEAATLRQSVERNLNVVKQRLDKIDTVKHGNVAAVAKKELMTDLACLSCGRDAVMYLKDKPSAVPPLPPAAHSIHPFIAFSLDKMKQIQAKNPSNRTMIQYEDLVREYLLEEPWKKGPMTHVCNRYEGGSETRLGGITRLAMRGPRHRTKQTTSAVVTSLKERDQ